MSNEPLDRPIRLLRYQIQQRLDQGIKQAQGREDDRRYEVFMRPSFTIGPNTISPALCIVDHLSVANSVTSSTASIRTNPVGRIRWLLDIETDHSRLLNRGFEQGIICSNVRSNGRPNGSEQLLAIAEGCDYWSLWMSSVELRIGTLGAREQRPSSQLLQVGARAVATTLPNLVLRFYEPLPLYFLTRTLTGQRTYVHTPLPLQVCDLSI